MWRASISALWMAPVEDTDAEELKARFEEFGFEVELSDKTEGGEEA